MQATERSRIILNQLWRGLVILAASLVLSLLLVDGTLAIQETPFGTGHGVPAPASGKQSMMQNPGFQNWLQSQGWSQNQNLQVQQLRQPRLGMEASPISRGAIGTPNKCPDVHRWGPVQSHRFRVILGSTSVAIHSSATKEVNIPLPGALEPTSSVRMPIQALQVQLLTCSEGRAASNIT